MTKRLKIDGVDNRGTSDVPYGYVYFSDGARVGFGDYRDGMGTFGLFGGQYGWPDVTLRHFVLASEKLHSEYPKFVPPAR